MAIVNTTLWVLLVKNRNDKISWSNIHQCQVEKCKILHGFDADVDGCVLRGDDLVAILDKSESCWDCRKGDFIGDRGFWKKKKYKILSYIIKSEFCWDY